MIAGDRNDMFGQAISAFLSDIIPPA